MKESEISGNDVSNEKKKIYQNENDGAKTSFFHRSIPIMPKSLAIVCCILNIIIPGFGNIFKKRKIKN